MVHSHTHSEPYPSPTDVAQAPDPAWHYVIVSFKREAPETPQLPHRRRRRSPRSRSPSAELESLTGSDQVDRNIRGMTDR